MKTISIKTFSDNQKTTKPHFYVLNKGLNSGKPLQKPCLNCFIIEIENDKDKESLYWLLFGLWRSNFFHPFLRGSVIPFITIGDFKKCLSSAIEKANLDLHKFQKSINALKLLEQKEKHFKQSLKLIDEARRIIFYAYYFK
jgi:hypothetical protein